jgi:hypothetical protein
MVENHANMAANIHEVTPSYKQVCAGKGCRNKGIHALKVRFLNKMGFFCNSCKDSLITCGLIVYEVQDTQTESNEIYRCVKHRDTHNEKVLEVVRTNSSNTQTTCSDDSSKEVSREE